MSRTRFSRTDFGLTIRSGPLPAEEVAALKLLVQGFRPMEHLLLNGTVKLSQRRQPRIELLGLDDAQRADVVMIDAADPQAKLWADNQAWLNTKAVIWVDSVAEVPPGQVQLKRNVQWPILPQLLARALENRVSPAATPAPRSEEPKRQQVDGTTSAGGSRPQLKWHREPILIVDDSLAARSHMRSLLASRGFDVTEVSNAEDAILAAVSSPYACILMDVLMPGTDGYEACRRIKANARSHAIAAPAIVMLTSKSSPFDRIRGKMAGCEAYLTKPVNPAELYEVLSRYTAGPPSAAARPGSPPSRPPKSSSHSHRLEQDQPRALVTIAIEYSPAAQSRSAFSRFLNFQGIPSWSAPS